MLITMIKHKPSAKRRPAWAGVLLVSAGGVAAAVALFWLCGGRGPAGGSHSARPSRDAARRSPAPAPLARAGTDAPAAPEGEAERAALRHVMGAFSKNRNAEAALLGQKSVAELFAALQDEALPQKTLRALARELARRSTDEAWAAIEALMARGSVRLRACLAEMLGGSPRPEAQSLLRALLAADELTVVQGALRGLGASGNEEAVGLLAAVLAENDSNPTARAEAALALGSMKLPAATTALAAALQSLEDPELREAALMGLGRQPFSSTESFFRSYLAASGTAPAQRAAALECVANAEGEVAPLLLEYTGDADPSVRAAAAWGLTMTESQPGAGTALAGRLSGEGDAEVRTRLYQALIVQEDFDLKTVLPAIEQETAPAARLAGYDLWASQCGGASTATSARFDQVAVPYLQQVALTGADRHESLSAVIALSRAGTGQAQGALRQIATQTLDPQVAKAADATLKRLGTGKAAR